MRTHVGTGLRRTEIRVVLGLFALLALLDLGLRAVDQRLSGNLAHIAKIPELIAAAGKPERESLLFLGNSLTNNGVAPPIVASRLPGIEIGKVTPDGSTLWGWQCLLKHQVLERADVQFDTVVIGFAWHLLSDQSRANASRLGALYCETGDLAAPSAIGLRNAGDIGEFIAARLLRMYALRETLRNRFFQIAIPSYERFTQAANAARAEAATGGAGGTDTKREVQYTYRTFAGLARQLSANGTRVVVVAMPVQSQYELDPTLQELDRRGEVQLIDLRHLPGLNASHFLDSMHLNAAGQQLLSRALAESLQQRLPHAT